MRIDNSNLFLSANNNFKSNEVLPKNTSLNISSDKSLDTPIYKNITTTESTLSMDIQNTNLQLSSIQTINNKTKEDLGSLTNIKELLQQLGKTDVQVEESTLLVDIKLLADKLNLATRTEQIPPNQTYISDITVLEFDKKSFDIQINAFFDKYLTDTLGERAEKELSKASYFLNENQKFFSEAEKNSYQKRLESANINPSNLPSNERAIYFDNLHKSSISDKLDKRSEFDSSISSVYNAKRILEDIRNIKNNSTSETFGTSHLSGLSIQKSFSLNSGGLTSTQNHSKDIDEQINILDEVHEKLIQASKDTVSIVQKESLYKDIKELLKDLDPELIQGLLEGVDEFSSSTSYYDEHIEKNTSFSTDTQEYLQFQAAFIVEESEYSQLKNGDFVSSLTKQLDSLLEKQKAELEELSNPSFEVSSLAEAKSYEEKFQRRESDFVNLSEGEKRVFLLNKYKVLEKLESNENSVEFTKLLTSNKNDYNKLNAELNERFKTVEKVKTEELRELLNGFVTSASEDFIVSAEQASEYLEKVDRRRLDIKNMSESEKEVIDGFKNIAQRILFSAKNNNSSDSAQVFKENIDTLIENVDNLMNLLNKSKLDYELVEKNIQNSSIDFSSFEKTNQSLNINAQTNYKEDRQSFSKHNISEQNGSFILSQTQNMQKEQLFGLIV